MEDSAKALTPPLIDIADAKIRSLSREFKDRRFWMERKLHRYPVVGLISEWDVTRGLTTLAAACLLLGTTTAINLFVNQRHVDMISQPALVINTKTIPDSVADSKREALLQVPKLKPFGDITERAKDVLEEEGWIRGIVDDPRLKIPEAEKDFWVKRMLALIAIESQGRIHATSGIAFGFTQLKKETADEIAKQYQIPSYDLYNPWDNTFLGLAHQLKLADRYGKDLSLWAHHLGSGNIDEIILAYLKPILPENDSLREKGISSNSQLKMYIEHYGITSESLLQSPKVREKLIEIGANQDETDQYWLRYKQVLNIINSQTKA